MCGLVGIFLRSGNSVSNFGGQKSLESIAYSMGSALQHRGPDSHGLWLDEQSVLALVHRRLKILDLTEAGHQPMESSDGRYMIVFNGEIYNHSQIRIDLEIDGACFNFRGNSDTETLLAAIEFWGLDLALTKLVGMFAIALWDRQERKLYLIRDRFGEKPLYYGWANGSFIFGSELKALCALPGFCNPISRPALALYLRFNYIPAPWSIYAGIFKLEPGCLLEIGEGPLPKSPHEPARPGNVSEVITIRRWWEPSTVVEEAMSLPFLDAREGLSMLEGQLAESVGLQALADVPVGAFLSGGIDSSLVVSLLQDQSNQPVRTYTIGFTESKFDESPFAKAVSNHLGTIHTQLRVTPEMALEATPLLPDIFDEPFADSSQIPTYLLSKLTRNGVKVTLSGDGGDELFGGYGRYVWGPEAWAKFERIPLPLRTSIATTLQSVSPLFFRWVVRCSRAEERDLPILSKIQNLVWRMREVKSKSDFYRSATYAWAQGSPMESWGLKETQALDKFWSFMNLPPSVLNDDVLTMMFEDTVTYLPDDILCKVDRCSMACGLEVRTPFLDHRVMKLAWRLPLQSKLKDRTGKRPLREMLLKYLPEALIDRPKAGFSLPLANWLRGPLREWAEEMLDERRLRNENIFSPMIVRTIWAEHLSGYFDHTPKIWSILMFQAWFDRYRPTTG